MTEQEFTPRFGEIIRNARKEKKLTLDDVGKAVGWSGVYLFDVEKGNRPATQDIAVITKLSEILDLDLIQLTLSSVVERKKVVLSIDCDQSEYIPWATAAGMFLAKLALAFDRMCVDEFEFIEENVLDKILSDIQ